MDGLYEKEIRSAIEHLFLIKAHMRALKNGLSRLRTMKNSAVAAVMLRQAALDVRMIVEETMQLSVSAHRKAGQQISKTLQDAFSASKKMSILDRINPKSFPDAIEIVAIDGSKFAGRFISVKEDYLKKSDAKKYYHWCDHLLHASHKRISEDGFREAISQLTLFYRLTERLFRTFEVDITSGSGLMFLGHLNLDQDEAPALFFAGISK